MKLSISSICFYFQRSKIDTREIYTSYTGQNETLITMFTRGYVPNDDIGVIAEGKITTIF